MGKFTARFLIYSVRKLSKQIQWQFYDLINYLSKIHLFKIIWSLFTMVQSYLTPLNNCWTRLPFFKAEFVLLHLNRPVGKYNYCCRWVNLELLFCKSNSFFYFISRNCILRSFFFMCLFP
jgi:hypothetical protein